jgi:hypothetical protein
MKVSDLINEIVFIAETKFGISDHNNDCIGVVIYPTPQGTWNAYLSRPTSRSLDTGEFPRDLCHTVRVAEERCGFNTESDTLLQVLLELRSAVEDADENSFCVYWAR